MVARYTVTHTRLAREARLSPREPGPESVFPIPRAQFSRDAVRPELEPARPSFLSVFSFGAKKRKTILGDRHQRLFVQRLCSLRKRPGELVTDAGEIQLGVLRAGLRGLKVREEKVGETGNEGWICQRTGSNQEEHGDPTIMEKMVEKTRESCRVSNTSSLARCEETRFTRHRNREEHTPRSAYTSRTSRDAFVRSSVALRSICAALDLMRE